MASFREFLCEGTIGDVQIGMRPEAVETYLGPADDRSMKKRPVEILKFGAMELGFKFMPESNDSRLIAIALYFSIPDRALPSSIVFEDWTPTAETTQAEFRDFIHSAGMQIHTNVDGENTYLALDSGASVVFVDERLHSVHFHRTENGTSRRQISVSLPESTLTQLRARADRENVSLGRLIENVLSSAK